MEQCSEVKVKTYKLELSYQWRADYGRGYPRLSRKRNHRVRGPRVEPQETTLFKVKKVREKEDEIAKENEKREVVEWDIRICQLKAD